MDKFLQDLASKKPAPGGGSASALAGAMAAALVNKVASLTIGKEKYKEVEKEFREINKNASKLQKELLKLADEDCKAYQAVVVAHRLPKDFDHLNHRSEKIQEALKKAAEVPLETAQKSLEVLKMASYASEHGNQNLRSDAFCAIELATAAIYGALENVRVNFSLLKDQRFVDNLRDKIEAVLNGASRLVKP